MPRYDDVPIREIPQQLVRAADDADALAGLLRRRTSLRGLCDDGFGHVPFRLVPTSLMPENLDKLAEELRALAKFMEEYPSETQR